MERETAWCLVLLLLGLPPVHTSELIRVVIDSYTHNSTLTSGVTVPLGTQIILVCRVVGLPYGTPLSYTWTCPNGPCEVEGYYGRKVYNEHILAVNTTSTSDGGTYTCQVTATRGQEATGNFTVTVNGGDVVHSYGRLIPHEFPITDLQQISGPNGIGRINCTVSSGNARFVVNSGGQFGTGGVSQTENGATRTLVVNPSNVGSFQNRGLYCTDINTNFLHLFISSANTLNTPRLTQNSVTNSTLIYDIVRNNDVAGPLIVGYEVTRFGVPMIGEYVNTGRGRTVTISPVVPGAQYRITAWALGDGRRSATPAVVNVTTREAMPSSPRMLCISRTLEGRIELNWLPPTDPNGVVHYVIYYTPENGTEQSMDTESDLTHYNLTGLERNRVYTNIAVKAVNSAGRSDRSVVTAQYNHTPPVATNTDPNLPTSESNQAGLIAGVVVVLLVVVLLSLVVGVVAVVVVVRRRNRRKKEEQNTKAAESYKMYMNLEGKGSPDGTETIRTKTEDRKPVDPDLSEQYSYAITNLAPDPKGYNADMYTAAHYSEVDQIPSETETAKVTQQPSSGGKWDHYEDLSVEVKKGGSNECVYAEPDAPTDGKLKGSSNKPKKKVVPVNAEQFYAQPDMAKKRNKKTQQQQQEWEGVREDGKAGLTPKEEIVPVCPEDFYAQPDMAKKRNKRTKQHQEQEEVSEDSRAAPLPPAPYKKSLQEAVDVVP